uniref:BTB domain-containing protein n=1 Tax=Meloidogyne incognita TaxID=6306 RepID=A0A914M023_MELIC
MADLCGTPMRPSDSWSSTEVRSLQHSHMWTIKGFSQCECRYLETSLRIKDSASSTNNTNTIAMPNGLTADNASYLTFKIRLHPQGNKESNKDFCFFQAKFSVFNTRSEEVPATVYTGTQQLNGYFEYIRRDVLIGHIQPSDEIQLLLNLTIVSDTITKNSQNVISPVVPEPRPSELAKDLEQMFGDTRHSDFTIICDGDKEHRELPAHKVVLGARSPVFAAMFEPHTEEAQKSEVHYNDIDFEVMREMLFYMYSGTAPSLQQMALDLLAVADRFQLIGLKEMADQVLRNGLCVDNVCRNLVLADMHNALELKQDALRFIAQYSNGVIVTDGWATMVKEHPRLVTEVVAAMSLEQSRLSNNSSVSMGGSVNCGNANNSSILGPEPLAKRSRYDA